VKKRSTGKKKIKKRGNNKNMNKRKKHFREKPKCTTQSNIRRYFLGNYEVNKACERPCGVGIVTGRQKPEQPLVEQQKHWTEPHRRMFSR
jgi:hypothetical protein